MQLAQRFTKLQFSGDDWRVWLQGQITQDVRLLNAENQKIEFCLCKPTGQMLCHGTLSNEGVMSVPSQCVQVVLNRVDQMVILEECFVERLEEFEKRTDALKPIWGTDMTEVNFPAEMGAEFEGAVISYSKGCYTGQEVNHRLHARGHTNKTWMWLFGDAEKSAGQSIVDSEGKSVGQITRVIQKDDHWLVAGFVKNGTSPVMPIYQP